MPLRSEPAPPMLMPSSSQRTHVRGYSPSATFHALPPAMAALSVGRNVSSPAAPQLNHSGRIVTTAVATPSLSAAVTGAGVKWRQVAFAIVLSRGGWSDDVNADAGFCVPVRSRTLLVGRGAAKLHAGQIVPANVLSIAEQQNARPPVHVENQGHHFRFPRKQVNPALPTILTSEEEWSQNRRLIEFKDRGFRRTMVPQLPYFAVQWDYKGFQGYGKVIEGVDANQGEKGGEEFALEETGTSGGDFPHYFAAEIIGTLLDLEPRRWRKPRRLHSDQATERIQGFKEKWSPFDWTRMLDEEDGKAQAQAGSSRTTATR
ncbi:unnamed protein product [Tilletia caries]|nr:unnamed protein product [Tilletia caries]